MDASQLMTQPVVAVGRDALVSQAIHLMSQNRISGLPVVADDGRVVGMLSEGDLLRRVEIDAEGDRPNWFVSFLRPGHEAGVFVRTQGRRVRDVMTEDVISVSESASASEIVKLMLHHRIKRIPVLRDGVLVGVVSRADLVRRVGEALSAVSGTADDAAIARAIHAAMEREKWVPRNSIRVAVTDGVVELEGCVTDMNERKALGVLAENVVGAKRVENGIVCIDPQMGILTFDPARDQA